MPWQYRIQDEYKSFDPRKAKFYHGTSNKKLMSIIDSGGIIPNALRNGESNFYCGSNSHCVYLTNVMANARFYGSNSTYNEL